MKVLLAPLHWGLGHAARTAALIDILLDASVECSVASDGAALEFIRRHFGDRLQSYVELPAYPVIYDEKTVALSVLKRSVGFFRAIQLERKEIARRASVEQWDLIISDNRYGARVSGIPSVFLGHQLQLKMQFTLLGQLATYFNRTLMRPFDQYWVPDFPDRLLSGKLSSWRRQENVHFIGPLHKKGTDRKQEFRYRYVVVLSGPEPSRTRWEQRLLKQIEGLDEPTLFVRGLPAEAEIPEVKNEEVDIVNFMTKDNLNAAISLSEVLISRAGYSTIMDICFLRKPAVLIPTPGQTEQEYLADYLKDKWPMAFFREKDFDLKMVPTVLDELRRREYPEIDPGLQSKKVLQLIQSLCD